MSPQKPVPGADEDRAILRSRLALIEQEVLLHAEHHPHCAPPGSGWTFWPSNTCGCWFGRVLRLCRDLR
jgi:hypothetical protein